MGGNRLLCGQVNINGRTLALKAQKIVQNKERVIGTLCVPVDCRKGRDLRTIAALCGINGKKAYTLLFSNLPLKVYINPEKNLLLISMVLVYLPPVKAHTLK